MAEVAANAGQGLWELPHDERPPVARGMDDRSLAFLQGVDEGVQRLLDEASECSGLSDAEFAGRAPALAANELQAREVIAEGSLRVHTMEPAELRDYGAARGYIEMLREAKVRDTVVLDPQLTELESIPHVLSAESLSALQPAPWFHVDEPTRRAHADRYTEFALRAASTTAAPAEVDAADKARAVAGALRPEVHRSAGSPAPAASSPAPPARGARSARPSVER
ncbi:hypothetical protein [Pimelobacter sp. 30-1]|uniref:hypothetical protein n=1 Tax=Pimelobacter sp. 30-1 TaxID=2004991 RepID=UPI001C051E6B|nr:hypothetical protein [Pimelobacter sp. 30-1]